VASLPRTLQHCDDWTIIQPTDQDDDWTIIQPTDQDDWTIIQPTDQDALGREQWHSSSATSSAPTNYRRPFETIPYTPVST
jgi:hypothetical protein